MKKNQIYLFISITLLLASACDKPEKAQNNENAEDNIPDSAVPVHSSKLRRNGPGHADPDPLASLGLVDKKHQKGGGSSHQG